MSLQVTQKRWHDKGDNMPLQVSQQRCQQPYVTRGDIPLWLVVWLIQIASCCSNATWWLYSTCHTSTQLHRDKTNGRQQIQCSHKQYVLLCNPITLSKTAWTIYWSIFTEKSTHLMHHKHRTSIVCQSKSLTDGENSSYCNGEIQENSISMHFKSYSWNKIYLRWLNYKCVQIYTVVI